MFENNRMFLYFQFVSVTGIIVIGVINSFFQGLSLTASQFRPH